MGSQRLPPTETKTLNYSTISSQLLLSLRDYYSITRKVTSGKFRPELITSSLSNRPVSREQLLRAWRSALYDKRTFLYQSSRSDRQHALSNVEIIEADPADSHVALF
jgi:hypothetical protein